MAVFTGGQLHAAKLAKNPVAGTGGRAWLGMLTAIEAVGFPFSEYDTVAVETMQIDSRPVPPADLLELNGVAGAVLGAIVYASPNVRRARGYTPKQWKGTIDKETHHRRALKLLTPAERRTLGAGAKQKDIMDAVALGLYELGRMK